MKGPHVPPGPCLSPGEPHAARPTPALCCPVLPPQARSLGGYLPALSLLQFPSVARSPAFPHPSSLLTGLGHLCVSRVAQHPAGAQEISFSSMSPGASLDAQLAGGMALSPQ